ncbi:O-acyltransferase WSD1, C-terminal [Dillenia turbinata]|uniref:O-acyltransferase WSD1, C-terminal n=1 Tax=Dillenia turbinata TaxID=194707 RepID=A0AAN8ZLM3_9MAGN
MGLAVGQLGDCVSVREIAKSSRGSLSKKGGQRSSRVAPLLLVDAALLSLLNPFTIAFPTIGKDEPLSPTGKMFLQQDMYFVNNCVFCPENPLDVVAAKFSLKNSAFIKYPRFCSLLVRDENGEEHWRKTKVDLERHLIILEDKVGGGEDEEEVVNHYMADLAVSSPLSTDKPLWEFHSLMAHKCVAMRVHHASGDGISLMSLFLACCRKADDPNESPTMVTPSTSSLSNRRNAWKSLTAEDSKMMDDSSRSRWGNDFGVYLLPLYYYKSVGSPLDYLKRAKAMITKKKLSMEALAFHILLVWLLRRFGTKACLQHNLCYLKCGGSPRRKWFEDSLQEMKDAATKLQSQISFSLYSN